MKNWFKCILILLLVFSVFSGSLLIYGVGDEEENPQTSETSEASDTVEAPANTEEVDNTNKPVENNQGASESLEGFTQVSSKDDAKENLDLYFNKEEISFKVAQNDSEGNILKVWSSQLSLDDLGLKLPKVMDKPGEDASKELKDEYEAQKSAYDAARSKINTFDKQSMSLFVFTYVNLGDTIDVLETRTWSFELDKILRDYTETGTGVSFKVEFPSINVTIPLIVEVSGQELNVRIPVGGLYENTEGGLVVREKTEVVEASMNQISDLIVDASRQIKGKLDAETDKINRSRVESALNSLNRNLSVLRTALITGRGKSVDTASVEKEIASLYVKFERDDFYNIYGSKLEENVNKIVELANECLEAFKVFSQQISNGLYSIQVAPFLGSGTIKEDGYVFYPDGAGAISRFNVPHPMSLGVFESDIYKEQVLSFISLFEWYSDSCKYPVFGVNKGEYGFVGIIDEGDCDASIRYTPGNTDYVLGRVQAQFYFRRKIKYFRNNGPVDIYDINRIEYDRNIKYIFLKGKDSGYSGMANAFRDYLKEENKLNDAIKDGEKMPVEVSFLMGLNKKGIFGTSTLVLTSYEDVQNMLERLRNDGVEGRIYSTLYNWAKKKDVYPNRLDVDNALGGKKGLTSLTSYAKNNNAVVSLDFNPVYASREEATSEEINKHYMKDSILMPLEYKESGFSRAYFSPKYIKEQYFAKSIDKLNGYGANSATVSAIGSTVYYDYVAKGEVISRKDTADIFAGLLEYANDKLGYSSVFGGNMYLWKSADRITNIPLSDDEYFFADESVPFLQMVLHGNIGYSGSYPYNVLFSPKKQTLEYIEYGIMPSFLLTQESIAVMEEANNSWAWDNLYTTDIDTWYDDLIKVYNEFEGAIGDLWDKEIVHHEQIQKDVKRIEYSCGSIVYVNYNDKNVEFVDPYTNASVNIDSESYYIARKGE